MGTYSGPPSASDGLVLYLDAANSASYSGSGNTWYDLSGNSNKATFVDSPSFQSAPQSFFNFDGSNDYMTIVRSSSMSPTSGLTQEIWFNFSTIPNAAIFIGLQYGSSSNNTYALWMESSTIYGGVNTSGSFTAVGIGISNISGNKWHNFVHTYDGTAQRLYLDGVLLNSSNITGTIQYDANNTRVLVGADDNGSGYNNGAGYFHKGKINQIKIYNRALTSEEITRNYNASKKRYFPEENVVTNGLILNIDPSKPSSYAGSGNTIYDLSGSGNTGSLINGPAFSGLNGGTIVFDATNDYISMGTASSVKPTQLTLACFFKINTIGAVHVIAGKQGTGSGAASYALVVQSGQLHFRISNSSGTEYNASTAFSNTSSYNYAVGTYDGSNLRLYLNGASVGNSSLSISIVYSDSYPLLLGYYANSIATNMNVGSLKLYDRVLSATEIEQNYNALRGRYNI